MKEPLLGKFITRIYERNHKLRNIALLLGLTSSSSDIQNLKSSRTVEYPWVFKNIDEHNACKRLLDVGSVSSTLPIVLVSLGYEVWSIDVRQYEYDGWFKNLKCLIGDIRKTSFEKDFFDCVIAVSTIEHIGLGRYGEGTDSDGDIVSAREILRILSLNGVLLFTLPYGKGEVYPNHRVYDEQRLNRLLDGFKVEKVDYFVRNREGFWQLCSKNDLTNTRSPVVEMGLICIKARKI